MTTATQVLSLVVLLGLQSLAESTVTQDRLSQEEYDEAITNGQSIADSVIHGHGSRRERHREAVACGQIVVAEGDSWFDYRGKWDILEGLIEYQWAVFSAADAGDSLHSMMYDEAQRASYIMELERSFTVTGSRDNDGQRNCAHDVSRVAYPKAVLLSVGGNDIIEAVEFLLEHGASRSDAINEQIANGLFHRLNRTLVEYITLTRHLCRHFAKGEVSCGNIPVFLHGYDYAQPSGVGYGFWGLRFRGPWLRPAFETQERYGEADRVIRGLIDRYNTLLCNVAERTNEGQANGSTDGNPIYHLDFRNVVRDNWEDEIHPNEQAVRALSRYVSDEIGRFHMARREEYCITLEPVTVSSANR